MEHGELARDHFPSSERLMRSTAFAAIAAAVILLTVVLPAEYAIDPTGIGGQLGLTQMGEIKSQLTAEASRDRTTSAAAALETSIQGNPPAPGAAKSDEISIALRPGEGTEVKLEMRKGARASFQWSANGDVNFETHADGAGKYITYEKGRTVTADQGTLVAAFDGNHGWFWRNMGRQEITLNLQTEGDYILLKRLN